MNQSLVEIHVDGKRYVDKYVLNSTLQNIASKLPSLHTMTVNFKNQRFILSSIYLLFTVVGISCKVYLLTSRDPGNLEGVDFVLE